MKEVNNPYDKHIFVCCNTKTDGTGCALKGGEQIREKLKIQAAGQQAVRVRVNKSGCLGFCENGVAVACYPDGKIFLDVKEDDAQIQNFINRD